MNASSGKITGRPTRLGTSTSTITVSDAAGTAARTTFTWTIQTDPTLSRVALADVGAARPKLSFTVTAGRSAPRLATVTVALPRGLRFTRSRATVSATGVGNRRLKLTASLQHGTLVLKVNRTSSQVHVTIAYPRMKADSRLAAAVASRRSARLTITVRPTDALRRTTNLTAKIRPGS
jgi:hypothetical protein